MRETHGRRKKAGEDQTDNHTIVEGPYEPDHERYTRVFADMEA